MVGFGRKGGAAAPASFVGESNLQVVQKDWDDRDFTQSIQLGVAQLVSFLNDFGARRRGRWRAAPPHGTDQPAALTPRPRAQTPRLGGSSPA